MAAPSVAPPGIGVSITIVKFNNENFVLWSRVVKYLTAKGKYNYLTDEPPASESKDYSKWLQEDTMVTTWLWNSMDLSIAATTMWVQTTKEL
ncbi:hypothetical protein AB3S75_009213 [Citrus x aurantiifolia]